MSCGCGGGGRLPANVQLRQFAVNLAHGDVAKAGAIMAFLLDGVDEETLDGKSKPGTESVAARNALLNASLAELAGTKGVMGDVKLGTFAQFEVGGREDEALLAKYGLHFGMTTDELRAWVLEG
jgi:hypothetical protein